jgi:hypothetical protein
VAHRCERSLYGWARPLGRTLGCRPCPANFGEWCRSTQLEGFSIRAVVIEQTVRTDWGIGAVRTGGEVSGRTEFSFFCYGLDLPLDKRGLMSVRQSYLPVVFSASQRPALLAEKLPQFCQNRASVRLGSSVAHRRRASGVSFFQRGLKPA